MKVLAFDIEADGLLVSATKIHCGVIYDYTTNKYTKYTDSLALYKALGEADRLVAHNGRMYDGPVLERLVGRPNDLDPLPPIFDTLLISRLLWSDRGTSPSGGHSLEKWGSYLGFKKEHTDIEDWSTFTPQMLERCVSDVRIQKALYEWMMPRLKGWEESIALEHRVATIITKQIENGFTVDLQGLEDLENELIFERAGCMDELSHIPPWVEETELQSPAYWEDPETGVKYETKGQVRGRGSGAIKDRLVRGPNKVKREEILFSPSSDDHIRRLLQEKYGWVGDPRNRTKTGKDSVKGEILEQLDYPEIKSICKISEIDKILGFLTNWKECHVDGVIHGGVITNGTVAGRMAHNNPNMGQVPGDPRVRRLLIPRSGWKLVGGDASALEAMMLGNRVAEWDDGEFGKMLEKENIHDVNQRLAELETRAAAKTFYFKFVYGGKTDPKLEKKLYAACPGLKKLKNRCIRLAKTERHVTLVDGRRVHVRKRKLYGNERTETDKDSRVYGVAVNNLLQGDGAVVMKKALCIFYDDATETFGPHGERWGLCANVHDEIQVECEPEIAEQLGQMIVDSITKAGQYFEMKVNLTGAYDVGDSWAETH